MQKTAIVLLIGAILAAFFYFDLGAYLTIDALKGVAGRVDEVQRSHPLLVIALFFTIYVAATAASVPGAAVLTLAAGALFGVVTGTIIVSFASTVGATLAFLASRTVLRDTIERRFGDRLAAVNTGLERDGAFYLFTLRMIPVFPFFIVNLVMGLTRIRTWTYAWVSQVGMFFGTIVFVNAGTQLSRIDSLSGIVSPAVLASFAALGVAPWFAKGVIVWFKRRKAYRGYKKPRRFDRNLVVIGGGSAGLVAAYIAAQVKAKVTLVEADKLGGDCLNTGCVPSKALIKAGKVAATMRHADTYGIGAVEPEIRFRDMMQRVRDVITAIEPHDSIERFTGIGVDMIMGRATIIDPWTVEIAARDGGTQRLTTRSIVIAAGAAPVVPPIEGLAQSGYWTSETMWDELAEMDAPPRRVTLLGGGPIGCEMAQALARLGCEVTQVEMADGLLEREDDEVSTLARDILQADGVKVLTGHRAVRVEASGTGKALIVAHQAGERSIEYDALIIAVGREARLSGYGLEALGIATDKTIVTDDYLATGFPNIFAAGDVAGPFQFTHTASHQAWFASVNALFGQFRKFKADYRVIPAVTFLDPEIARVGLNEKEAADRGINYEITRYDLDELDRAITEGATTGFVKILTVPGKDRILGVTIIGQNAGELLAEYVLAMKHGLGLNKILGTIHSYPTMAEANKFAAGEWKKAHKPEGLLRIVESYHSWRRG